MGNKQNIALENVEDRGKKKNLVQFSRPIEDKKQKEKPEKLKLTPFSAIEVIDLDNRVSTDFEVLVSSICVDIKKSFQTQQDLEAYISNLIKLSKMLRIRVFDDLQYQSYDQPYTSEISMNINDFCRLSSQTKNTLEIDVKMDLLFFITNLINKIENIYFTPNDIAYSSEGFILLNFTVKDHDYPDFILTFMRWIFNKNDEFKSSEDVQIPPKMPIYLEEIYQSIVTLKLTLDELQTQIPAIKDKISFLMGKTDSFYACSYFKKINRNIQQNDWIFLKNNHEIHLFNINDHHVCLGKVVRKSKKIDLDDRHMMLDPEQLQIVYIPENSKFIVKIHEFEFESSSTVSDIEIKYKFPLKFKTPFITQTRQGQLLVLEQFLYRYSPSNNKIVQETKKISEYIFLSSTRDGNYFIIKISIDIFRNGIRVFIKDQDVILLFTGNPTIMEEILSIRVDVRSVNFCIEVYKGVFILMASRNIWILDLNFECFFSFATCSELKKLAGLNQTKFEVKNPNNNMLFSILNQPFKADFDMAEDGNNFSFSNNCLHVLGKICGHPYYLRYQMVHRMGALKLEGYQSLSVNTHFKTVKMENYYPEMQEYSFNFHQQNSHTYKYSNWIMKGKYFVEVFDFHIKWEKSNYQVFLKIEKIDQTLKSFLEEMRLNLRKLLKIEMILLLYQIYIIFEHLHSNSITHRNISVNHLCFTKMKMLKINGWCEPPRNWHMSDYRDYLLTCFNVITYSSYEKLSDKILQKHEHELKEYPLFQQKIKQIFKQSKTIEKMYEIEKNLQLFKSSLQNDLCQMINKVESANYIFCLQYNTPRFIMFNITTQKMKKIIIIPDENLPEEFTFNDTDILVWNQQKSELYIFKASYNFFQAKINTQSDSQEKIMLEDYEYLPNNISSSSFIYAPGGDLLSFGGIKKEGDGKSFFFQKVYRFNWINLTWDSISDMPQPRVNAKAVLSNCQKYIYIVGGLIEHEYNYFKPIQYNRATMECLLLVDESLSNPMKNLKNTSCSLFHLSSQLQLFMLFSIDEGEYIIRYFSCNSAIDVEVRAKNFSSENNLNGQSVAFRNNTIHLLRTYGKWTKIVIYKLESASPKNQTIYAL